MSHLASRHPQPGRGARRALPRAALRADPAVPPGPGAGRLVAPRGPERDRRTVRRHRGRGAGHGHLLRHAARRARRHLPGGGVHQHRLHARRRARAAGARRVDARRPRRGHDDRRRVHPARGRVPGRLRPHAVRAGQPPLRRRPDPRELRRARRGPARRRALGHGARARDPGARAPQRRPAGRPRRHQGRAGRGGRGPGGPAEARAAADGDKKA